VDPPAGAVLDGRYRLEEEIGRGAMGVVYRARDEELKETIAIKILKAEYGRSERVLERFRREILLGRDIQHPNVLRVYHLGTHEGRRFLAMKLVEGRTLSQIIRTEGPMAPGRILSMGIKIASAVQAAHDHKVIHRDIKPQNILIDRDGEPYLTDFGLARLLDAPGTTQEGVFLGTPWYASPEQANLRAADERSDVYALGLVLYEMATGRRPFRSDSSEEVLEMHRRSSVPDPSDSRPGLPRALCEVILCCLQKAPEGRYQSAAILRSKLEAVRDEI
jgi:serine/threonine-protein kinase